MKKLAQLYAGKAKTMFETDDPNYLIMEFRNDVSAFNGVKLASLDNKGKINNQINAFLMNILQDSGIPVHFKQLYSDTESIVRRLDMIPVECVVRNYAAGGISKRLGIAEGVGLNPPVFEFFYKSDELGDPMVNESHILTFGWATTEEIQIMRDFSMAVNRVLLPLFEKAGLLLIDYKLEFGRMHGTICLADELTPDGCRIWDAHTLEKMDKDRFRRDLGEVVEHYELLANRLQVPLRV